MSDYGFRISKTGVDVKTGDDKDMVLTSKYPVLKGSLSGSGVVSVPRTAATQTVTIAHGLGYIPMVQAFYNDRDGDEFDPNYFYEFPAATIWGVVDFYFEVKADATNVYLLFSIDDYGAGGAAIDIRYSYFIFIDKGKL